MQLGPGVHFFGVYVCVMQAFMSVSVIVCACMLVCICVCVPRIKVDFHSILYAWVCSGMH